MATNNFPGIGYTVNGRDFNFYQKVTVTSTTFGGGSTSGQQPDIVITFPTQSVMFLNEDTANVVEFSFNGQTVHGELDPTKLTQSLTFDNRPVCKVWFRIKSGSSGSPVINIMAWGTR